MTDSITLTLTKNELFAIKNGMFEYLIEGCDMKIGEHYTDETAFKIDEAIEKNYIEIENALLKKENELLKQKIETLIFTESLKDEIIKEQQ